MVHKKINTFAPTPSDKPYLSLAILVDELTAVSVLDTLLCH
jgi:hypothetical protein